MSDGPNPDGKLESLLAILNAGTSPGSGVRIAAKRSKHSARLGDRIQRNAESVEQLLTVIRELTHLPDTTDQVEQLIDIAKDLLNNNAQLREQVEEALQDIPD